MSRFKPGDKVVVVNYGHLVVMSKHSRQQQPGIKKIGEDQDLIYYDSRPQLIGKTGVVKKVHPNGRSYDIKPLGSWFDDCQLENA